VSLEVTFDEYIKENLPEIAKEEIKLHHTKFSQGILFSIKHKTKPKFSFFSSEDPKENQLLYCEPIVYKEIEKYFASATDELLIKWVEKEYGLNFSQVLASNWVYFF
jgi:hypothetical protein